MKSFIAILLTSVLSSSYAADKVPAQEVKPPSFAEKEQQEMGKLWPFYQAKPLSIKELTPGIYLSKEKDFALEVKDKGGVIYHDSAGERKFTLEDSAFGSQLMLQEDRIMNLRMDQDKKLQFGIFRYRSGRTVTFSHGEEKPGVDKKAPLLTRYDWTGDKSSTIIFTGKQGKVMKRDRVRQEFLWRSLDKSHAIIGDENYEVRIFIDGETLKMDALRTRTFSSLERVKTLPKNFTFSGIQLAKAQNNLRQIGTSIAMFFTDGEEAVMPAALHDFAMELCFFAHPLTGATPKNFDEVMEGNAAHWLLYEPLQFWEHTNQSDIGVICTRPGALGKDDLRSIVLFGDGSVRIVELPKTAKTIDQVKEFFIKRATAAQKKSEK